MAQGFSTKQIRHVLVVARRFYLFKIEPWFKRRDEIFLVIGNVPFSIKIFRFERYLSPTIKKLCSYEQSKEVMRIRN